MLLVYFGWHRERFFAELARLTAWPEYRPDRDGDPLPIRSVLAYIASVFAAPRVLLVWSDPEEPWTYAHEWQEKGHRQEQLPPDVWRQATVDPLSDRICLFEPTAETIFLDEAGNVQRTSRAAVNPSLRRRFDIGSGISIPIRGESIEGRLFVLRKGQKQNHVVRLT